jgi:hypothetical protein
MRWKSLLRIFLKDFDLALIELHPDFKVKFTNFNNAAVLENTLIIDDLQVIAC